MEIQFLNAKNNEITAISNSIYLHSSYNPTKEAERIVNSISIPFNAENIIITEPAVSYLIPLLKEKFNCKIGIIRFFPDFNKFNNGDFVINYYEHQNNFKDYLLNYLTEENIFNTYFLAYEPSAKAFEQANNIIWNEIKEAVQKAKTLLITRQYFEKKWLLNTISNLVSFNSILKIKSKTSKPVLICASGPSLKNILPYLKNIKEDFFIICLSSAISVLNKNNIEPDLYLTTDGGFWANEHLKKIKKDIPLGISLEAFCSKNKLKNQKVLPLVYEDGISKEIYDFCNLDFTFAKRNGTVSGTALNLAESITENDIYFAGLDLCCSKGFQHTQPNELEFNNEINDSHIKTKQSRLFPGELGNESLKIYEEWFKNYKSKNNVYRIINNPQNNLGSIIDISSDCFLVKSKIYNKNSENIFIEKNNSINSKNLKESIKKYINENSNSNKWIKSLFTLDYVSLKRDPNNKDLQNKIDNENKELLNKIWKILDD